MQLENKIIKINKNNSHLLETFIAIAGKSLSTFRYFNQREITVIENHLCTYIIMEEDKPVAYGHLDKEDNIIWLGIAVSETSQGKGFGKIMLEKLIKFAEENDIPTIRLSVDADNKKAIQLYHKFGFRNIQEKQNIYFLEKQF